MHDEYSPPSGAKRRMFLAWDPSEDSSVIVADLLLKEKYRHWNYTHVADWKSKLYSNVAVGNNASVTLP